MRDDAAQLLERVVERVHAQPLALIALQPTQVAVARVERLPPAGAALSEPPLWLDLLLIPILLLLPLLALVLVVVDRLPVEGRRTAAVAVRFDRVGRARLFAARCPLAHLVVGGAVDVHRPGGRAQREVGGTDGGRVGQVEQGRHRGGRSERRRDLREGERIVVSRRDWGKRGTVVTGRSCGKKDTVISGKSCGKKDTVVTGRSCGKKNTVVTGRSCGKEDIVVTGRSCGKEDIVANGRNGLNEYVVINGRTCSKEDCVVNGKELQEFITPWLTE